MRFETFKIDDFTITMFASALAILFLIKLHLGRQIDFFNRDNVLDNNYDAILSMNLYVQIKEPSSMHRL